MDRKDLKLITMSVIFAAVFALIISTLLFNGKQKRLSVPVVENISSDFPDVYNDPSYQTVFNKNALDPTQPITISPSNNGNPFGGQ